MSPFSVGTEVREGETIYVLADQARGASVRIWPAFGNNCLAYHTRAPNGCEVDVILEPPDLTHVRQQPSWWGTPLLFPWPGRIPGGRYVYRGTTYQLPNLEANGSAIHGFVKTRRWRVDDAAADAERAALRCSISSDDHPETLEGYPFPYRVTAAYELNENGLSLLVTVANTGNEPLPFGFGAHPYFRLPLAPGDDRGACLITVPAARRWNLARIAALGPDERVRWDDVTEPVSEALDLRARQPLGEHNYDNGFAELEPTSVEGQRWIECAVANPRTGVSLAMQATPNFGTIVVYTPPGRPGICFEPWTCPPNVFNLAARGLDRSGLIVLDPGQRWEGTMRLICRSAGTHGTHGATAVQGEEHAGA
ncbi:MAG: aldose 1-epimerase [Chloroflexi bacterium]|nr:aldose 1-epimerase [Chloroflexota bacterium]